MTFQGGGGNFSRALGFASRQHVSRTEPAGRVARRFDFRLPRCIRPTPMIQFPKDYLMYWPIVGNSTPSARVTNARIAAGSMLSGRKWTLASANTELAPPGWNENGSSFKPQLLVVQGHAPLRPTSRFVSVADGPPIGVALLLM